MSIIRLENIAASYGKKEVLKGISLQVNTGEIVSLIGPNGAGKSTILKVIMGILLPSQGSIYFENEDITLLPVYKRAAKGIGFLYQGGSIFTNMTVDENIHLASHNSNNGKLDVFDIFPELREQHNKRAGLLSGGLKQMLSISMLLIRKPKVLLLDEPSAGLAPSVVKILLNKIKEVNDSLKIPILLVEQNIRQALNISQRVYIIKSGKVDYEGEKPVEILEQKKIETLFFEN